MLSRDIPCPYPTTSETYNINVVGRRINPHVGRLVLNLPHFPTKLSGTCGPTTTIYHALVGTESPIGWITNC